MHQSFIVLWSWWTSNSTPKQYSVHKNIQKLYHITTQPQIWKNACTTHTPQIHTKHIDPPAIAPCHVRSSWTCLGWTLPIGPSGSMNDKIHWELNKKLRTRSNIQLISTYLEAVRGSKTTVLKVLPCTPWQLEEIVWTRSTTILSFHRGGMWRQCLLIFHFSCHNLRNG